MIEHHEPQRAAGGRSGAGLRAGLHDAGAPRARADATRDFVPSNYVPFQPAPPVIRQEVRRQPPVYWGFGGKRRPDAWAAVPGEREAVVRTATGSGKIRGSSAPSGGRGFDRRSPICFLTSRPIFSAAGSRAAVPISRSLARTVFSGLRLRPIQVAVHVVGERRHVGDAAWRAVPRRRAAPPARSSSSRPAPSRRRPCRRVTRARSRH